MTCIIIEATPGPNMGYIAVLSASDGRRAGFAAVAGIALGLLIIGVASALGVATLITNSAIAYQILRWGGIFYLLWLAWETWKPETMMSQKEIQSLIYNAKFFKRGLITNLLNPKAAIFYVAMLPKFITHDHSAMTQAIILTLVFVFVATAIHGSIVVLAGSAHRFLEDDKRRRIIRRFLAVTLIGIAIWFAIGTGQKI
jgi:threonine/homoserine/homoserine lactone efflux protein